MVPAENLGAELMVSSDFGLVSEPTPGCAPLCPKRFSPPVSRSSEEVKKFSRNYIMVNLMSWHVHV